MTRARRVPETLEAAQVAADLQVQERGDGPPPVAQRPPVLAREHVHRTHPDTGLDVVFVPGEALPGWAVDEPDEDDTAAAVSSLEVEELDA